MPAVNPLRSKGTSVDRFSYGFAQDDDEVCESLALRHRVFVQETGARIAGRQSAVESDALDDFCLHLIVREQCSGEVVACTRILTHEAAIAAGQFHSADKFDLSRVLACPGRFMEIGRTFVDARHRGGAAITALWAGISDLIRSDDFDHLIGCVRIDATYGTAMAHALYRELGAKHLAAADRRVRPRLALPGFSAALPPSMSIPPLLEAYINLGADIAGPPCWDPDLAVADLFMYLQIERLSERHARHFRADTCLPAGPRLRRQSQAEPRAKATY